VTDSEGEVSGSKDPGSRGRIGAGGEEPGSESGSSGSSTRKGLGVSSP